MIFIDFMDTENLLFFLGRNHHMVCRKIPQT